jgi:phage/plasmid-like protein (TIGR03299 family)
MSRETIKDLNNNTLIGYTLKRGRAWHYRAADQGAESNHYEGAIPVADVHRRLFNWSAVEGSITATALTPDGVIVSPASPDRKAIMRSDTGAILGIFKDGYKPHQYGEWLVSNVESILDDGLNIGSAGVLKGGAVAWVSVEEFDTVMTPEGVEFRPYLLATTSFDGSIATQYKLVAQLVVCDNTLAIGLSEKGPAFKVKHTRYSSVKLNDARAALELVHTAGDEFSAQVAELCNTTVTDDQWSKFLDSIAPTVKDGVPLKGRSLTMADNKRADMSKLWNNDTRVSPWRNTAFGVIQAVNTYTHHEGIVRGESRADRNMLRAIDGGVEKLDQSTYDTLLAVLN